MKRTYFVVLCVIAFINSFGQTSLIKIDFESAGGYTTSIPEFTDGSDDFFIRTDGSNIGSGYELNNIQGSSYFAAQDIDGEGAELPVYLSIENIDISGFSNLQLRVYLAEDDDGANEDWDNDDFVHFDFDIDNSGSFSNLLWIENSGETNTEPRIDTDFDGTGDGQAITYSFHEFTVNIPGAGNQMELRITFNLESGDEDIAIDKIEILDAPVNPEPTNYPSSFSAITNGSYAIQTDWTDATGSQLPSGYLIMVNQSGSFTDPVDGTEVADDMDLSDGDGAISINYGIETYTWTGLDPNTQYYFQIFPYTNSGLAINYKTDGTPPSANATTDPSTEPNAWINEFHYDNDGGDVGEFVEIVIEDAGSYNLSDFQVDLYNGNDGQSLDYENANNLITGNTSGNFTIYYWEPSSLQNGPDGIALSYQGNLIIGQFLSYGGFFMATDGPANGETSIDVVISESSSTPVGKSLRLKGHGNGYSDFSWQEEFTESPGRINFNQYFGDFTTWTGNAGADWSNASNWSDGVPGNTKDVFIPAGLTNYPTLSSTVECNDLAIESASVGTGSLIGQNYLTVNGTTTVERRLTGNAWHIVSSPAPGQTISSFLLKNTNIPAKDDGGNSVRGMMDYDETNNVWNDFFTDATGGNLTAGKGFSVRTDADGAVSFAGALQTGTINVPVSTNGARWNSVGNPYLSSVHINDAADVTNNFIELNLNSLDENYTAVYVWENGAYSIISKGDPDAFHAQVGQGFMVRVVDGISQLQFTTDLQTHEPGAVFKSAAVSWPQIKLRVSNEELQERLTRLRFDDSMSKGLDPGYDAGVFKTGFDIYTRLLEDNGVEFGVQCLPYSDYQNFVIPVGLDVEFGGELTFKVELDGLDYGKVVLNDQATGTDYAFTGPDDEYMATVVPADNGFGRFALSFTKGTTGFEDSGMNEKISVWQNGNQVIIAGKIGDKGKATVYNMNGQILSVHTLENKSMNSFDLPGGRDRFYLIKIEDVKQSRVLKLTRSLD